MRSIICFLLFAAVAVGQDVPTLTPVKNAPPNNKVAGISLSDAQVLPSSQKAAVVVATCEGAVKWEVHAASGKDPSSAVLPDGKNLIVFLAGPDVITVRAYSTQGGQPTDTATTTIAVTGAEANPVQKTVVKLHATFILPVVLNDQLKALTADDFKAKLKASGVEWHIRQGKVEPEFTQALAGLGGIPAMIVSDKDGSYLPELSKGKIAGVTDALKSLKVK